MSDPEVKSKFRKWQKGESGNPAGRPPGAAKVVKLREQIGAHVPDILNAMISKAKAGDVQAARLILERLIPPLRAVDKGQAIDLPGNTLSAQGRAIFGAIGAGQLPVSQGATLLAALGTLAKVMETDELENRIKKLENQSGIN